MYRTTFIEQTITDAKEDELAYRRLHPTITIRNESKKKDIIAPYISYINKYSDFLSSIVVELDLTDEEILKYKYKPKTLSYDLYNTTELWFVLLSLNHLYSKIDFCLDKYKVYDPRYIVKMINEILIMEGVLK